MQKQISAKILLGGIGVAVFVGVAMAIYFAPYLGRNNGITESVEYENFAPKFESNEVNAPPTGKATPKKTNPVSPSPTPNPSFGVDGGGRACIQVVTTARHTFTGEIRDFPTPCDVPDGWEPIVADQADL